MHGKAACSFIISNIVGLRTSSIRARRPFAKTDLPENYDSDTFNAK